MKRREIQYKPKLKKNIEYYQYNNEGSEIVNRRYNEVIKKDNLHSISIEYFPNQKKPSMFILIWEEHIC